VVSVIVAKSEGQLDLDIYNDPDAGTFDTDDVHLDEEVEREMAQMVRNTHDHK
jgi:hypothetical protein